MAKKDNFLVCRYKGVNMNDKTEYPHHLTPDFWKDFSRRLAGDSGHKYLKGDCWDKAASTYDDLEVCSDYMYQVNTIMKALKKHGALSQDQNVLDVACGTGTYALRMAPHCREVVALDISEGMLNRLKEKQIKTGIQNIRTIQADWHHFSCDEKFGLVFVSMTPLLQSMDNIDRFLEYSDRFLAIVCWAGIKENPILDRLHEEIHGEKRDRRYRSDIIILFNYLYSMGYAPELKFFHGCWERARPVDRQVEGLIWQLETIRPLKDKEKDLVKKRMMEIEQDGIVRIYTKVRIGFMLIDKKKNEFPCPPLRDQGL